MAINGLKRGQSFTYFLVATAQWNFIHGFLSSIPPDFSNLFLNSKYFSKKLHISVLWTWNFFCDQYSFMFPTFNYLQVATVRLNFIHIFFTNTFQSFSIYFRIPNICRNSSTCWKKKFSRLVQFIALSNEVHSFLSSTACDVIRFIPEADIFPIRLFF